MAARIESLIVHKMRSTVLSYSYDKLGKKWYIPSFFLCVLTLIRVVIPLLAILRVVLIKNRENGSKLRLVFHVSLFGSSKTTQNEASIHNNDSLLNNSSLVDTNFLD